MGKVNMPSDNILKKVFVALFILVSMISVAFVFFSMTGIDEALPNAVKIVTHVEVVTEQIEYRYVFALLGIAGGVVQFYLIYVILEYMLEGKLRDIIGGVRFMNKAKKLNNHYVVAGGGRVGSHVALILSKYDKKILVIDKDEEVVKKLRKDGYLAIEGDVLDEEFLKEVNLSKAKALITCLAEDSDNILLMLTAKDMNPGIKISAKANSDFVVDKMKHAGAGQVVVPSSIGGEELAKVINRVT